MVDRRRYPEGWNPNPLGISGPSQKPYRDALRAEIAAAGADHKALRRVARAHLKEAGDGNIRAIKELADRLDGRVPAESTVTSIKVDASKLSDNELAAIIQGEKEPKEKAPDKRLKENMH